MQEAADRSRKALVHIVDEGIEETCLPVEGDDVVVGDGSRDEDGVTLLQSENG